MYGTSQVELQRTFHSIDFGAKLALITVSAVLRRPRFDDSHAILTGAVQSSLTINQRFTDCHFAFQDIFM